MLFIKYYLVFFQQLFVFVPETLVQVVRFLITDIICNRLLLPNGVGKCTRPFLPVGKQRKPSAFLQILLMALIAFP